MRIAIDGLPLNQSLSGVGYYTLELAKALASTCDADTLDVVSPRTFHGFDDPGVELPGSQNLKFTSVSSRIQGGRWFLLGLPRYLRRNSIDLFHGTNFEVPLRRICPSVLTIHDLSLMKHPETHTVERVRRARLRLPLMLRQATSIITPTETVRNEVRSLLNINEERVFAVPEAPRSAFTTTALLTEDIDLESYGIRPPFILGVGTLEPRKNLVSLVLAYRELIRTTPFRPQLVIAGKEGWLNEKLLGAIALAGPDEKIILTGRVTDVVLRCLYGDCVVMVYPSVYEGFGLPPIEAMSCGSPVIANRIPTLTETLGNAAEFVDCTDVSGLRDAIAAVMYNPDLRTQLINRSLNKATDYSWERTAHMTRSIYDITVQRYARSKGVPLDK